LATPPIKALFPLAHNDASGPRGAAPGAMILQPGDEEQVLANMSKLLNMKVDFEVVADVGSSPSRCE